MLYPHVRPKVAPRREHHFDTERYCAVYTQSPEDRALGRAEAGAGIISITNMCFFVF